MKEEELSPVVEVAPEELRCDRCENRDRIRALHLARATNRRFNMLPIRCNRCELFIRRGCLGRLEGARAGKQMQKDEEHAMIPIMQSEHDPAFEAIPATTDIPLLLTCEHASNRLPAGWSAEDDWLKSTHWAWDIGAAEITRHLARETGAGAVLATWSRLLVDLNRGHTGRNLFRTVADGRPVQMNLELSEAGRAERLERYWVPFHDAVAARVSGKNVFSVHSFTPVYEGSRRSLEMGVLFYEDEPRAQAFADALIRAGFETRLNEPYSGMGGMMYSAHRHARAAQTRSLELEIRQDLLEDASMHPRIVRALLEGLAATLL